VVVACHWLYSSPKSNISPELPNRLELAVLSAEFPKMLPIGQE
jgi:hypothetical protein